MSDQQRAYVFFNGQYKHVYIIERREQSDIYNNVVTIYTVKLTKYSKETYDFEASKILDKRPHKPRKERA